MIRVSKHTDYGILMMALIAADNDRLHHTARHLSQQSGLPLPMVSKVLKALTRGGVLVSQRGAKGGYSLAGPSEDISVADIIRALEGTPSMTSCCDSESPGCEHQPTCPMPPHWQRINQAFWQTLEAVSLTDIATNGKGNGSGLSLPVTGIRSEQASLVGGAPTNGRAADTQPVIEARGRDDH